MKHQPKPKGSVIAALDVGSSKIACFIGHVVDDEGHVEVIGVGHHAAKGMKGGTVTDIVAVEEAIRQTVHAAENMAAREMDGYPLRDVVVNMPALYTRSHPVCVDIDIQGHEVTEKDLRRAIVRAQKQQKEDGWTLIHSIPTGFSMDGHEGIEEPVGMQGRKLSVNINLVDAEKAAMRNMARCVERSHLDVESFCLSAYASGLACLIDDEMELGATVIEMGAGITSFALFHKGALIYSDSVPVGGDHVTNDIVQGVNTTIQDAERLKILYGSALATSSDEAEMLDIPQIDENGAIVTHHVPRSVLVSIIQPRLEEILEMIKEKMDASGLLDHAGQRIIMTGGACQIPGLRDLAQMTFGKQVRLGRPVRLKGVPDSASGPGFASVAGLLHYICERYDEQPHEVAAKAEQVPLFDRMRQWLRENW